MESHTSSAFYYSVSSDWLSVTTQEYSTLGNAFIVAGLIQLYRATGNSTYLAWASNSTEQFWDHAWDASRGGFYDMYLANWSNTTCTETTQNNAMFLIDFLDLYLTNGSSVWLSRASETESLLNSRFWNPSYNTIEVSSNLCTGEQSGDVHIEVSIGSNLWATSMWTQVT